MKIKLIGCVSTRNEVNYLNPAQNVDCEFLDYSYHAQPSLLKARLQQIINRSQDYDLIVLTHSRCSNAICGLVSANVPLLFPDTHDCLGLLLGSQERFLEVFTHNNAVYFFSQGWLDFGTDPYSEYLEYVAKYGSVKAKYLINTLYGRYNEAVFITTPGLQNIEDYRQRLKLIAGFFNWKIREVPGDLGILQSLIKGSDGAGVIRVEPGVPVSLPSTAGGIYESNCTARANNSGGGQ